MSALRGEIVLKMEGRALEVQQGNVLRIIAIEGEQVADVFMLNRHDFKEQLSGYYSAYLNNRSVKALDSSVHVRLTFG